MTNITVYRVSEKRRTKEGEDAVVFRYFVKRDDLALVHTMNDVLAEASHDAWEAVPFVPTEDSEEQDSEAKMTPEEKQRWITVFDARVRSFDLANITMVDIDNSEVNDTMVEHFPAFYEKTHR